MGNLRAPKRVASTVRRRGVQGRLSITVDDDVASDAVRAETGGRAEGFRRPVKSSSSAKRGNRPRAVAPLFHPLAYRGVVAGWSLESREQWGRRANELEDTGLAWRDAETQAFVEVWHHLRRANAQVDDAPAAPDLVEEADVLLP